MNAYDKGNLDFLLNSTPEELLIWYAEVDEEDHIYASELLAQYSKEIEIRASMMDDEVEDTTQSIEYLERFRIRKI